MTNSQQNLNNKADHQFGDGNDMTHAQKIEFLKTQQQMTNETKQTAVDFAFEKLASQGLLVTKDYKNLVAYLEAKEMEKEQIINARIDGDTWSTYIKEMRRKYSELYYNETYGGNNEQQ